MNKQDAIEMLKSMLPEKISYAELIGASSCYGDGGLVYADPEPYAIETAISALEQQLTDMWIPISKRMPNHEEYCKNDGRFIVTDGNRVYQALFDIYDCKAFCNGGGKLWDLIIDTRPIAWKPLPEPYKEASE